MELLEREVYGRVPANVPVVRWEVMETREVVVAGVPMFERHLEGKVDNSAYPAIKVTLQMTVATPKNATQPVPVLLMFGGGTFGGGRAGGPGAPGGPGA